MFLWSTHVIYMMACMKQVHCLATLRLTKSYLYPRRQIVADLPGLKEGTKAGELCITLLDVDCCHSDSRGICKADTLGTQLIDHLIINITDDLVSEGAFAWSALYQAIGKQDVLLILSTTKSSRCGRCCTCCPNFSVRRSQLKYDKLEILSNGACHWPFFHWNCCQLPVYNIKVFHNQFPNSIS